VINPPTNRVKARLRDALCPQCVAVGGLAVISALTADETQAYFTEKGTRRFNFTCRWRPVLVCDGCDLYEVGRYGYDGNTALFGRFEAPDEAPEPKAEA
jgi:hypothetical protein